MTRRLRHAHARAPGARLSSPWRGVLACAAGLGCALALAGCPSTATTSLYIPITGFVIDSQQLTAGLGCGTGAGQVYKYAAVVTLTDKTLVSGVFDCFTNAQFGNLPTPDGGTTTYPVVIYAYDFAAFPQVLVPCSDVPADAACPGEDPTLVLMHKAQATWTAQCTGTQVPGMSQVATCSPLVPNGAVVDGGSEGGASDSGRMGDGGDAGAPPDAAGGDSGAADATPDAAASAISVDTAGFVDSEGGALRCSTDYDRVFATYTGGGQSGTTAPVACPAPLVISPAVPGAAYSITAMLVRAGTTIAKAPCQAVAGADAGPPVVASCGAASP